MCEEVVIPASQVRKLYFSIMISDKTELCSVNVQKVHFEEKKKKKTILWLLPQQAFFPETSREIGEKMVMKMS